MRKLTSANRVTRLYGNGYQYYGAQMHWSGRHVAARLPGYNDHEEKPVQVEWDQPRFRSGQEPYRLR